MDAILAASITKGSPTLFHTTCFGCGQEGRWKKDCPRTKVTRARSISHLEENILKCAHDAIKAFIGLKTVNLNIMLMGDR
jgi:hypothetical protein